jgi:hypothetical protein
MVVPLVMLALRFCEIIKAKAKQEFLQAYYSVQME